MLKQLTVLLSVFLWSTLAVVAQKATFQKTKDGVVATFSDPMFTVKQKVALRVINDQIIHVKATPLSAQSAAREDLILVDSLKRKTDSWILEEQENSLILRTAGIRALLSLQ